MLDEIILNPQNTRENVLVLLFLYNKYMKMNRPRIDNDVAPYGKYFIRLSFSSIAP
jgi:hypothetical protein